MKLYARFFNIGKGFKKIDWILPYVHNKEVLEIGSVGSDENPSANEYWLHRAIAKNAKSCLGIDNNKALVTKLSQENYNIIYADAQNFNLSQVFDIIVAGDVIEHLEDPKGFLQCAHNHLKDNGLLLITTCNPWFFLRFLRCLIKGDGGVHADHTMWFCTNTLTQMLRRNNFKVEKIEFGSSEPIFYKFFFLPDVLSHTSIFAVAKKS
jgi:2-polyprenyl-3-methyl-5-hydroxy-6-metoxy-1,4-benzoquinol methylase